MKKIIIYAGIFLMLAANIVWAAEKNVQGVNSEISPAPTKARPPVPVNQTSSAIRVQFKNTLEAIKTEKVQTKEALQEKITEMKQEMEQKRIEVRNKIEAEREKVQAEIQTKKQELQARLQNIKDEAKKERVERIYDSVQNLNKRLTDHYLNVLEKLENVLSNITSRAAKAELNGLNIAPVKTAISEAENAINTAKTAVQNQAAKVYPVPTITSADTLKTDVAKIRNTLHSDLKSVFDSVKNAREAIRKAATTLAQTPNIQNTETQETKEGATTQPTP